MKNSTFLALFVLFSTVSISQVTITVDPFTNNSIKGNLELNRLKYFTLADSGNNFENTINNPRGMWICRG